MGQSKPHLESSNEDLNTENYEKFLSAQRFAVIEVSAYKCAGCK